MTIEEAIEFLTKISYTLGTMSVEYLSEKDGEKMREAIEAIEQEPKRKKARWIPNGSGYAFIYSCSECGHIDGYPFEDRMRFCPGCGAKMEVKDVDSD